MMDEVNPMAEMGFVQDKQIIFEPQGFLTPCNTIRDAAEEFITDGGRLFDILDRYENVTTYVLNRDISGNSSDSTRLLAPFLKAFDTTDYALKKFYDDSLEIMPGAEKAVHYFLDSMPVFMDSRIYEHAAYALCDKLNVPSSIIGASMLSLDDAQMSRQTCKEIRGMAADITGLRISEAKYKLNVPVELDDAEVGMVSTLDDIFLKKFQKSEGLEVMQNTTSAGSSEKAYALLDIRKGTQVDLDGTVYIGGEQVDFQVLDLVKDGNGLAMSFNGSEFAVHGSNVAVISEDCTVAAVLAAKFYDTGIQGVFDLVDHWDRKYLEDHDFQFGNLVDEMLERNPDSLPEVYRIDRDNVDEIASRSDAFRTEMFRNHRARHNRTSRQRP